MNADSVMFNILTRSLSFLELEWASLYRNPSPLPDTGQNYHILAKDEKKGINYFYWDQRYCSLESRKTWVSVPPKQRQISDLGALPHCHYQCPRLYLAGRQTAQDAHTVVLVQFFFFFSIAKCEVFLPYFPSASRLLGNQESKHLRLVTTSPSPTFFIF